VKRRLRLYWHTWRARIVAAVERVTRWYSQRTCPHLFRAALNQGAGGRVCKLCDLAQPLSREDFYAEFGERHQAMLYTDAINPVIRRDSFKPTIEADHIQ
jgi:hypothetical protein